MKNFYGKHIVRFFVRVLTIGLMFFALAAQSQSIPNSRPSEGTDFIFSFSPNALPLNGVDPTLLTVVISSQENTTGNIEIPLLNVVIPFTVNANVATSVAIPNQINELPWNVSSTYGIHLTAVKPVSVNAIEQHIHSTDSFLVLPTKALGKEHVVMAYNAVFAWGPSQIAIVGTKDNTQVTITSPVATPVALAGKPYTFTLNRFETFLLTKSAGISTADLTGTKIQSSEPVSVTGGVQCTNVPAASPACDYLVEVTPPVELWGKSFTTLPLATRLQGDLFRVLASKDNTQVKIDGAVVATLASGAYYDKILNTASVIETSEPALVEQYSLGADYDHMLYGLGDPFMMLLVPNDRFLKHYTFATPEVGFGGKIIGNYCQGCWRWNNDPIDLIHRPANYINIVIPTSAIASITLDGVNISPSVFNPIGNGDYSGAQIKVSSGSHTLNSTTAFALYSYGFESSESYGHPVGMAIDSAADGDYENVRVISTLATNGVELDLSSFSVAPTKIEKLADQTNIEWFFPSFSIGQIKNLDYDILAKNLQPNEKRLITNSLQLVYQDLNGKEHKLSLGKQELEVLASGFALTLETDRTLYTANQSIIISPKVSNAGSAQSLVDVAFSIRDTKGNIVAAIGEPASLLVQGKETINLPPKDFQIGKLYAGDYVVYGVLKNQDGSQLVESKVPFTLSADETVQIAAQVAADKLTYTVKDTLTINAFLTNKSSNNLLSDITINTRAVSQSGTVYWAVSAPLDQLTPQANQHFHYSVPLTDAEVGNYTLYLTAVNTEGAVLATSQAHFEVTNNPLLSLGGQIRLASPEVFVGNPQTCTYTVTNQGKLNISQQKLTTVLTRLDDSTIVSSQDHTVDLLALADIVITAVTPNTLSAGSYACVLQGYNNDIASVLAKATFVVKKSPIVFNDTISMGSKGRLLILVDSASIANEQENTYLKQILDNTGWFYTLAKNAVDFKTELQRGGYSLYALLSENVTLDSETQNLLKAQVALGDGLIVSGSTDRRHQSLEDALGIKARANQAYAQGVGFRQSLITTPWENVFDKSSQVLNFSINGATAIGDYRNKLVGADTAQPLGPFGFASGFNVFAFEDFTSLSSTVEGRLAVGGNLSLDNFSVGNKLDPKSLSDVVYAGGNVTFPSGRIYYGNLKAGGSIAGVGSPVINGMAKNAKVLGNQSLPFTMEGERSYLEDLSQNIASLNANGNVTFQYSTLKLKGDCSNVLQVFSVDATILPSVRTFEASCIPVGATVIFNIIGASVEFKSMGMQSLTSIRQKVLFNLPQAQTLTLESIGLEGSLLAPFASVQTPAGNISGQVIVKSWYAAKNKNLSISNYTFNGDLSAAIGESSKNAATLYQYNQGKTVFIGFDLLAQASLLQSKLSTADINPFGQFLLSALTYVGPDMLYLRAGKTVPIQVDIENISTQTQAVQAKLTLSNNLNMVLSGGFNLLADSSAWVYNLSVPAASHVNQTLYIQLPTNAGELASIKLLLQTGAVPNTIILPEKVMPLTAH